jgi:hypothetical protein
MNKYQYIFITSITAKERETPHFLKFNIMSGQSVSDFLKVCTEFREVALEFRNICWHLKKSSDFPKLHKTFLNSRNVSITANESKTNI